MFVCRLNTGKNTAQGPSPHGSMKGGLQRSLHISSCTAPKSVVLCSQDMLSVPTDGSSSGLIPQKLHDGQSQSRSPSDGQKRKLTTDIAINILQDSQLIFHLCQHKANEQFFNASSNISGATLLAAAHHAVNSFIEKIELGSVFPNGFCRIC